MEEFNKKTKHDFDLEVVLDALKKCRLNDDTVVLSEYIRAYRELCRFFKLTGRLFGFVARDLEGKIAIVEKHRNLDKDNNYVSVQSILKYESSKGIAKVKSPLSSGSRTLLRLHNAFEFIIAFMKRVREGPENEKTSKIAAEVYNQTLSNHHPWPVQKMALLAVHLLPPKKQLIDVMCKQEYSRVMELLDDVISYGQPIYDITESVYKEHGLLVIP
ncbi:ceramide-1-phosphate transfer protein [Patella vulgata]|uniref:ceramide-1-phosphate transfer protein n=1 Tax=Patella vulgata TaxID=6465 RepID=UPI0021800F42|nr:ceramide-1-phosphate transfer protein [Patella vulgata]